MTVFHQLLASNTSAHWFSAGLAAAAFLCALYVLRGVVLHRLQHFAGHTDTLIDDFLVEVLLATRVLLAAVGSLYVASLFLELPPGLQKMVDRTVVGLMLLQCGFWATRGFDFWLRHRFAKGENQESGAREMTRSLLSFLGRVVLWSLVVLLILDNLGLNVTALIASMGIGGIAVALAVQNILGDLFASLSIAIDKPFVIGDFIIVDDLMGTVEHVGLKTSRIRSLSGEQIVFSNNDLLKSRIRNYKRMQERRVVFAIGVPYDTAELALKTIPDLIRQAIEVQPAARFDRAHLKGFGAFSLDFEAVYYVRDPDYNVYMDAQQAINLQLVREFATRGIRFAFPTQTLHIVSASLPTNQVAQTGVASG